MPTTTPKDDMTQKEDKTARPITKQLYWGNLSSPPVEALSPSYSFTSMVYRQYAEGIRPSWTSERVLQQCRNRRISLQNNHLVGHPKLAMLRFWEEYNSQDSNERLLEDSDIINEQTPLLMESFSGQPCLTLIEISQRTKNNPRGKDYAFPVWINWLV